MRYKTGLLGQQYSQHSISTVGIGSYLLILWTGKRLLFFPGPRMGLYEFCRMPFGLSGAPSLFQCLMDKTLQGLSFVTIYLDDILVHSKDEDTHREHLDIVFKRLLDTGLTLRGMKCHISMSKVQYLGHAFSDAGISPDPEKVQVIVDWPIPTSVTEGSV